MQLYYQADVKETPVSLTRCKISHNLCNEKTAFYLEKTTFFNSKSQENLSGPLKKNLKNNAFAYSRASILVKHMSTIIVLFTTLHTNFFLTVCTVGLLAVCFLSLSIPRDLLRMPYFSLLNVISFVCHDCHYL